MTLQQKIQQPKVQGRNYHRVLGAKAPTPIGLALQAFEKLNSLWEIKIFVKPFSRNSKIEKYSVKFWGLKPQSIIILALYNTAILFLI